MGFRGPYDPGDDRVRCGRCDGEGETLDLRNGETVGVPCAECRARGWVRELDTQPQGEA